MPTSSTAVAVAPGAGTKSPAATGASQDDAAIREKKRILLLSQLQELGQQNEELAYRIEAAKLADTEVFHAQKGQLQSKVLHEIAGIQTMQADVSRKLGLADVDGDNLYAIQPNTSAASDPVLLRKALQEKERLCKKQELEIKRLVELEHKAEKARDSLQKDMREKISVFSNVRKKYVLDNERLKEEHATAKLETDELKKERVVLERKIERLQTQLDQFGEAELEKILQDRMKRLTERETDLVASLRSLKEELVGSRRENEELWGKLTAANNALEEQRKKSETVTFEVKSKLQKVCLQKSTDTDRLATQTEKIKALETELKALRMELVKRKSLSATAGGAGAAVGGSASGSGGATSGKGRSKSSAASSPTSPRNKASSPRGKMKVAAGGTTPRGRGGTQGEQAANLDGGSAAAAVVKANTNGNASPSSKAKIGPAAAEGGGGGLVNPW